MGDHVPYWIATYAEIIWPLLIIGWLLTDIYAFIKWIRK